MYFFFREYSVLRHLPIALIREGISNLWNKRRGEKEADECAPDLPFILIMSHEILSDRMSFKKKPTEKAAE